VYRVGPAVHLLAAAAASSEFLRQAEAAVRHLADLLPEAIVSFCEPVGSDVLVRFHLFPNRQLMQRPSSAVFAPYQTASGLAFLAYADPETRQSVQMRHPFEVEAIQTWQTEARLEKFLHEVRAKGYVLPPFCASSRFRLAAWPNLSPTGRLLGVLGVAWHVAPGVKEYGTQKVLTALRDAAARVPATRLTGAGSDRTPGSPGAAALRPCRARGGQTGRSG
jgi:DNA-binding IclR family transcriptional regulator